MQRRAFLMRAISVGSVCACVLATWGIGKAETLGQITQTPATRKPAAPHIGWGEARDGLQIGLFPQGSRKVFTYGDTLELVMRARNVSDKPIDFTTRPPQIAFITLGEKGRLVLQTLGGGGDTVHLHLTPGETQELPAGRCTIQLVAPGDQPDGTNAITLALQPGDYRAECDYPLWMPDPNDPNRATAHRAKPGLFPFTIAAKEKRQPLTQRPPESAGSAIYWGENVNGLQGGIRRVTEVDQAALPANERKELNPDEILVRFYVRNTTEKPLRLSYHNFDENDASFWIQDGQGKDYPVASTFFTGLRALQEQTLQPGEQLVAGLGRLKVRTQEASREPNSFTPLFTAPSGQYTLRIIDSVRFAGLTRFDMTLVSAPMPFAL